LTLQDFVTTSKKITLEEKSKKVYNVYGCDVMDKIDLTLLHTNSIDKIVIDEIVNIPQDYYKETDVKKLDNVKVVGEITRQTDDIDYVDLDVSGVMILQDSISLEDIEYPFSLKIEGDLKEFITNLENSLDIIELLWENIVLEIPLKYTKVEDLSKFHGDGWKLVSEEEATTSHNPFNELLKNIEEE
jgi:uncharacterized protein